MLKSFSEHSTTGITVNLAKTDRASLLMRFAEAGIDARASEYSKSGIVIKDAGAVTELPGFAEGELFVQDEASRIAAAALDAGAGHTVVDVCAAPGGKTFAAAMAVGDSGRVYSFDIHSSKLSLIESGAQRLGFKNVSVAERDACVPCEELFGKADRVICDAPCSGLGVIGKKPDLRYKDFATVRAELVPLQAAILESSAKYVKDGGVIVYSTCTLTREENEGITDAFLAAHPEFSYESFSSGDISAAEGHITLLPHIHGTDGFYIAKLRKVKNDG
jgi:16S rRNA (cytosine967-C5)-methyltransferase